MTQALMSPESCAGFMMGVAYEMFTTEVNNTNPRRIERNVLTDSPSEIGS